jgi:hypothetical protein
MTALSHQDEFDVADFTDPAWMAAAIRMTVATAGEPTFAELLSIPHFSGPVAFGFPRKNICVWPTVSNVAADVLLCLLSAGEIDMLPCRPEVYAHADVQIPDLPLALGYGPFETPHWLPVKFRALNIRTAEKAARHHA